MAKNLGIAIIDLLESERVDLRQAAATVLAAVGKGDKSVEAALTSRLDDSDGIVRRIALEGLAGMGAGGIAPKLVPLLRSGDDTLATRAAQVLAQQGAAAEGALRKELGSGPVGARRVIAQLLLERGTQPAIEAILDQLGDEEFGEQALQLLRGELDRNEKIAMLVEKLAVPRLRDQAKQLAKLWAKATEKPNGKAKPKKAKNGAPPVEPARDPELTRATVTAAALLRLVGYLARPQLQSLLLEYADPDEPERYPQPIRLAAIAGLRRIVASSEAKGTEKVIDALIALANGDDPAVANSAVDTLRGARIPESLAKKFAALAKSKHAGAQKLAMERLPAGGGASAVKALIDALGGDDPTARDAAARGLAKAPEAVLPLVRALLATKDEHVARRFAGVVRSHRGHISTAAIDELVDQVRTYVELHQKGKASADTIVLERILAELIADVAPAKHVELLFERARRLRKAGKPIEAFGSLKPLLRSRADLDAAIDDEQRYFLAVLSLEAAGEGILRTTHADDPVFEQFARLAAKGFPVAKRLNKEKEITDESIYGLGFRLLESGDASNEELGAELLEGIIDERPRSKLAKAAKNKLKLTGHLDE
ncbi:MAG TPA: HEAT repeat domain-containing protein [Kofleriaceae bacterium]|nr:HEAT repeat domain-containing protein [Kofleriaceae bacterium]